MQNYDNESDGMELSSVADATPNVGQVKGELSPMTGGSNSANPSSSNQSPAKRFGNIGIGAPVLSKYDSTRKYGGTIDFKN